MKTRVLIIRNNPLIRRALAIVTRSRVRMNKRTSLERVELESQARSTIRTHGK